MKPTTNDFKTNDFITTCALNNLQCNQMGLYLFLL